MTHRDLDVQPVSYVDAPTRTWTLLGYGDAALSVYDPGRPGKFKRTHQCLPLVVTLVVYGTEERVAKYGFSC